MAVDEKTGELLGTGRRKSATARVRIKPGSGKITVNHRNVETYFPIDEHRMIINEPFQATENAEKFDVCLLYTSPSPRDRTRSRMPSSA